MSDVLKIFEIRKRRQSLFCVKMVDGANKIE